MKVEIRLGTTLYKGCATTVGNYKATEEELVKELFEVIQDLPATTKEPSYALEGNLRRKVQQHLDSKFDPPMLLVYNEEPVTLIIQGNSDPLLPALKRMTYAVEVAI